MSQEEDKKWDGVFMNVIQQSQGINGFFDTVFSFLRRNTDFFADKKQAEESMIKSCSSQYVIWEQTQKSKEQVEKEKKQREEQRKQKDQEQAQKLAQEKAKKLAEQQKKDSEKQNEQKMEEEVQGKATDAKADGNKKDEEEKGPPPLGNGGKTDKYIWTQTLEEIQVYIPIESNIKSKMLSIEFDPKLISVQIKGSAEFLLKGDWFEQINVDDSLWTIEDGEIQDYKGKFVHFSIQKWKNQWHWWDCVVKGDPKINTQAIQPENSNLSDLDGETRQTVEKMMFDMRQKQMGKPTSDEQKKQDMLQDFMKQHPEMDFSKCKFN